MRELPTEHPLLLQQIFKCIMLKYMDVTIKEQQAQLKIRKLIDSMAHNSLITGLEPLIGHIARASDHYHYRYLVYRYLAY